MTFELDQVVQQELSEQKQDHPSALHSDLGRSVNFIRKDNFPSLKTEYLAFAMKTISVNVREKNLRDFVLLQIMVHHPSCRCVFLVVPQWTLGIERTTLKELKRTSSFLPQTKKCVIFTCYLFGFAANQIVICV